MERYLEAAQQILDRAIITPDLLKTSPPPRCCRPHSPQDRPARTRRRARNSPPPVSIYVDGDYTVRVTVERKDGMGTLSLKVDGARRCTARRAAGTRRSAAPGRARAEAGVTPRVPRCTAFRCGWRAGFACSRCRRRRAGSDRQPDRRAEAHRNPTPEKLALHYRLLGTEPGSRTACRRARRPSRSCARSCARLTGGRWKPPTSLRS